MAEQQGLFGGILPPIMKIHRDAYPLIGIALVVSILGLLIWSPLTTLGLLAVVFVAFTYRDPDRVVPLREGLVLAASDGSVHAIDKVAPPQELGIGSTTVWRIAAVLNALDPPMTRAPMAGRITQSVYVPGSFSNPAQDKADEQNERRGLAIETPGRQLVAVVQIAGVLSRRLSVFVNEGDSVGLGQRMGVIRLGSRIDVYLPDGATPMVSVGQRLLAGETVLADLRSQEPQREARRI